MATKIIESNIEQLIPDDMNFNEGTEFGQHLIEDSLRKFGAGRSILLDKNNRIIAGNKTIENAVNVGLEDVIIVETDGTKLVAVKRTDVDLDTQQGREMALADNATAAADLEWDVEQIQFAEEDFGVVAEEWGVNLDFETEGVTSGERDNTKGFAKVTLMLTDEEAEELEQRCALIDNCKEVAVLTALRNYGKKDNTEN